nr:unnamed protein product [Callosobruchus analis]
MMESSEYGNSTEQLNAAASYVQTMLGGQPTSDTTPYVGYDDDYMNMIYGGVANKTDFPSHINEEVNPKVIVIPNGYVTDTLNISRTNLMDAFSEQCTENSSSPIPSEIESPSERSPRIDILEKDNTRTQKKCSTVKTKTDATLPVRTHSRTPVTPPPKKRASAKVNKEDLKTQAGDSEACNASKNVTTSKDVPVMGDQKSKLEGKQCERDADSGTPSDRPIVSKCASETVKSPARKGLPILEDTFPNKLGKHIQEVRKDPKRSAEDTLQPPPRKVARIEANVESGIKIPTSKIEGDGGCDNTVCKPVKQTGISPTDTNVDRETKAATSKIKGDAVSKSAKQTATLSADNASPDISSNGVHLTMFDKVKMRRNVADTKKPDYQETPARTTRQKNKRPPPPPPNITDNLLKLNPTPRTEPKPAPGNMDDYPAKYAGKFSIRSLPKKDAEWKRRKTTDGSSASKRDVARDSSSDEEERRLSTDNNEIFDKLVQQNNINQNISFIITRENKLKTKVRKDPVLFEIFRPGTRADNKVRSPIFFFIEKDIYLQKAIHRWKGQSLGYFST